MAQGGLQLLGLAVALLGWVALVAATALPQWETLSLAQGTIITAVATYRGLWMECSSYSTGQLQCKAYDSLLALSAPLQAARALMVVSVVLGPLALGLAVVGMKCTTCGDQNPQSKARVAGAGGGLFLLSGLCGLVACSWYAHRIISNFYDALVPVNYKFELGTSIFLGWAGTALALLGGALLTCSCPCGQSGAARAYPARTKSPAGTRPVAGSREYV